jgi:hypothetical protein
MSKTRAQNSEAGLNMAGIIANMPKHLLPIKNWYDCKYFGDFQMRKSGRLNQKDSADTPCPELSFVWVSVRARESFLMTVAD